MIEDKHDAGDPVGPATRAVLRASALFRQAWQFVPTAVGSKIMAMQQGSKILEAAQDHLLAAQADLDAARASGQEPETPLSMALLLVEQHRRETFMDKLSSKINKALEAKEAQQ